MTSAGVSAIVLAGGAAKRFGGDKLSAPYDGAQLLDRAVAAVAAQCTEVLVVLAPGDERAVQSGAVPIRRVHDPMPHGGPLVGLLAGLEAAREPIVLVAGGDMPTMAGEVLRALVGALVAAEAAADAAVLVLRNVDQPLPAAYRNGAATQASRRLIAEDERSLKALLRALRLRRLGEPEWRGLDPTAETLRDIDRPSDLKARRT